MPRLPAAGAGRKADPVIISYLHFPEAPPCGRGASLLFRPVTQNYVVHNIAAADTSPAIKIIALAIKPFVIHQTAARCALHAWSPPLRRFLPAKSVLSQDNKHFLWKSNLFDVGKRKGGRFGIHKKTCQK